MRAGTLDSVIYIQKPATTSADEYGTPIESWELVAKMRAAVLQYSLDDREGQRGSTSETSITFRTRYLAGANLDQRVIYDGDAYTIRQIKELGRGRGLDLICERVGS